MIQLSSIRKRYGSSEVLHGISLSFEPGRVYGIVGENGAGKTTLFRCMAGLEAFEGQVSSHLSPLKNHLGFLPAEPYFLSHLTGGEYLRLLCQARGKDVDVEAKNLFGLPLGRFASEYSTGMKKKLALTAILLQDNAYFILDEPFNGVDLQSNILLTEIILKMKDMGKTVLISSHIFSTLGDTCDEIHVLRKGEISESVGKEGFQALEARMRAEAIAGSLGKMDWGDAR
jgi:ABC-2 type transport system ATP-binding protein